MGAGGKANHNTETMNGQTKYKIEKEINKQKIVSSGTQDLKIDKHLDLEV